MSASYSKNYFMSKFIFIFSFLFYLALFLLLDFSQIASAERKSGLIKKINLKYTGSKFRDPFSPQILISEEKEEIIDAEETIEVSKSKISELFSLSIQGIIWNTDNPLVIINNQVLRKGEALLVAKGENATEKIKIMDIDKDGVTIMYSNQMEKLLSPAATKLRKRNDKGG